MKQEYKIVSASREHAPVIGRAVARAIGDDVCAALAGDKATVADIADMFTHLAAMENSQYSYRNTLVAVTPQGQVLGVLVGYDGARLAELRKAFYATAPQFLHKTFDDIPDETSPDEFYLDTLAVFPPHEGQGIATALLRVGIERAHAIGKPAGLLVDPDNPNAHRLYSHIGFVECGMRPFGGVDMYHLQYPLPAAR